MMVEESPIFQPKRSQKNWRVLVVDDDESIYKTYCAILIPHSVQDESLKDLQELVDTDGSPVEEPLFSLSYVSSGEGAYDSILAATEVDDPFSVVLLDMRMPGGWDGLQTAKMIRSVDSDVRIIFATAYMDYELSELQRNVGLNFEFIRKPPDQRELMQLVTSQAHSWQRFQELSERTLSSVSHSVLLEQFKKAKNSYTRLAYAVDQHAIISQADTDGIITDVNDLFCKLSGYSREELIGRNHRLLKSGYHNQAFYQEMWSTISRGQVWRGELNNLNKQKNTFWTHVTIVPILDNAGVVLRYIAIRNDITGLKQIEQQLIQAIDASEMAAVSKDSFIASMSHELRTPLTTIIGNSEILYGTNINIEQQELVHSIEIAGRTQLSLVSDLLDMSKIESGKFTIDEAPYNLYKLMFDIQHLFSLKMKDIGLEFNVVILSRPENKLIGDVQRIQQILINLVGNALKFTPHGSVTLTVSQQEELLVFSVKDTGVGINEELQSTLFDRFVQGDNRSTERFKGSGLGLYISYTLAQSMNGTLNVHSVEGEGAEFVFSMLYQESAEPVHFYGYGAHSRYQQFKGKVLFVEDLAELRLRQDKLSRLMGIIPHFATSGEEACELVKQQHFDLLFMDLSLPLINGEQAMQSLRADGFEGAIIALVTVQQVDAVESFLTTGGSGCLIKPIIVEEFESELEKHLEVIPSEAESHVGATKVQFSGNLLIAEDIVELQKLERHIFESMGLSVSFANNGKEAIDMAMAESFDLLFMDMQMPVMDGIEATKILRAEGYRTPIVALTANVMQKHKDQFSEAGCDDTLTKPIEREELIKCLSEYLPQTVVYNQAAIEQQSIDNAIPTELLEEFYQTIKEYREDLSSSYEQQDWNRLRKVSHNIKGCGSVFGYPVLTELATKVCDLLENGDDSSVVPLVINLIEKIDSIK